MGNRRTKVKNKFSYIKDDCDKCKGKGYLWGDKRAFRGDDEDESVVQCSCLKKMAFHMRMDEANIPGEFFEYTIDDFKVSTDAKIDIKEKMLKTMDEVDAWYKNGGGFFFHGPKGTGKTMIAIELLKAAARKGYSIRYEIFPLMFRDFQRKGYKADDKMEAYTRMINECDFLVLDELGKDQDYINANPEAAKSFLELDILRRRSHKPTILLANFDNGLADVEKYLGQYVASLASHKYEFINIDDADYRSNA